VSKLQITFRDINKRFGKRRILTGAKLSLHGGQCGLLCGDNGSGKSTLLRIAAGLEKPDRAEIDIGLSPISWRRCRKTLRNSIVYLHQQPYMFDRSVKYNLAYALKPGVITPTERNDKINEAMNFAQLNDIAECAATNLSGGERQRVALARAWLRQPKVMLLDEPTANMDNDSKHRTLTLLARLKEEGIALLVASHDPDQFESLADYRLELQAGRIINVENENQYPPNVASIYAA
jgi:tungstate transport system ATP-binding protein